jgi:protein TonB
MNSCNSLNADLGIKHKKQLLLSSVAVVLAHSLGIWALAQLTTPSLVVVKSQPIAVSFVAAVAAQPVAKPIPAPVPQPPQPIDPVQTPPQPLAVKTNKQQPIHTVPPSPPTPLQAATPPVQNAVATPAPAMEHNVLAEAAQPAAAELVKHLDVGDTGLQWQRQPQISIDASELRGAARSVLLLIEANEKGEISAVSVLQSSGIAFVDNKVMRAVRSAKLKPYLENGQAYAVKAKQFFSINLN